MWTRRFATLCALIVLTLIVLPPGSPQPVLATSSDGGMLQAAGFPFNDGFEDETLGAEWSTSGGGAGVVELSTDYVHSGSQSMFLGQKTNGGASASMTLSVDLSEQTDVFLDFWVRSATGSQKHTRRIYISDDNGANWTQVANLNRVSRTFGRVVIDLADAASDNGLVLNDQFQVLFFYDDSFSRGDAGDGMVIDDVRLLQRNDVLAAFPLAQESFENSVLPQGFYPLSFGSGTVEFSTDYAHSGSQGLFLGQNVGGGATARLSLPLDLSDQTDAFLSFQVRSATGSQNHTRRIYISDDNGANWTQVANLDRVSRTFGQVVIDLADAASDNGLVLNDQFQVLFFYDDSFSRGDAGDGMVIDDIRLLQRNDVLAAFPLAQESFENSVLPQGFYPLSFGSGTVEFSTDYAHSGSQGLFLGQKIGGGASARLTIPLDLSNQTEAFLSFQVRSAKGDTHTRRVYISDDNGANWTEVASLDRASEDFNAVTIDLA